jgi:hypothetical protein
MKLKESLLSIKIKRGIQNMLDHDVKYDTLYPFDGVMKGARVKVQVADSGRLIATAFWSENPNWGIMSDVTKVFSRRPGYSEQSLRNISVQLFEYLNDLRTRLHYTNKLYDAITDCEQSDLERLENLVESKGLPTIYSNMSALDAQKIFEIFEKFKEAA